MIVCTRVLGCVVLLWLWTANGLAAPCAPWVTQVVSIQGTVEVKRAKKNDWSRVQLNDQFCAGDSIRADVYSRAGLILRNETLLRLDQRTTLVLPQLYEEDSAWLELVQGAVHFISNTPYRLKIKTPFTNAAIEGTEFAVRVSEGDTKVWVLEGKVLVDNPQGSISLGPGDAAVAEAGKPPVPYLKITPRDAVQWALYYPPIIDYRSSTAVDPQRQRAVTLYRTGQIPAAIEALNAVPETARDSSFFTQRAALLLTVGQVQSAQKDIGKALALSPNSGAPRALQSVIALTRNDKAKAMSLAQEAVKLEPKSPTPQVALSYAQQAAFDIEGARESIKKALELAPDDPLAWARLSELELSSGELDDALDAAKKAEALDPELSRTQMVLGFAQLTEIDIDEAKESFNRAIELDPSAPLPRLGMGLAKIRQGDVEEGRRDIEVAAVLDPENSLIRSYLGKAYYEEKRGNVVSREFAMAKHLDPKDPTPWFYDAIYKQTVNRPVEALHDMQKAIELNDNRAVYRSSLLLDDDLAARSASLGRIYNDLGFQQRGLVEGWKSVNSDPGNYSAHRLLADNYTALPRHEIARVSELLQSQLLQPINITPVQPRLAESNLLLLEGSGPSVASFNEFNPLFTRNRLVLQASGVIGNNDTLGNEVTQSGLWNNFSYSLGQFHFETDGFGENTDLRHDIYNFFAQWAVVPQMSVQLELRRRETETGKVALTFDPLDTDFRQEFDQDLARVGVHLQPALNQDTLLSFSYQSNEIATSDLTLFGPDFFGRERTNDKTDAYHIELQHLYIAQRFNAIAGIGYVYGNFYRKVRRDLIFQGQVLVNPPLVRVDDKIDTNHLNAYLYLPFKITPNMTVTLGLSYDDIEDFGINKRQINSKFGLVWNITDDTILRAAAFRVMKRPFASNQTIEPTQLAGFNQFFDEPDGTDSFRYGIGLDHSFTADLFGGVELSRRESKLIRILGPDLSVPRRLSDFDVINHGQDEIFRRAYVYWTPSRDLAIGAEYQYERFDRENIGFAVGDPDELKTHDVSLTTNYFHSSGFFASFGATYVDQSLEFDIFGNQGKIGKRVGGDSFWVLNSSVGYRFPKRYGLLKLEMRNLTDEDFRFQSFFNPAEQRTPRFQPGRTIIASLNLWFH